MSKAYTLRELTKDICGTKIRFYGWVRRIRSGGSGTLAFIDIYDGTAVGALMCVASKEKYSPGACEHKVPSFEQLFEVEHISPGCAVVVDGDFILSPDDVKQDFELHIESLQVIGGVEDVLTYPIQKSTEKHLMALRQMPFLRMKSQLSQCLFRIRSSLLFIIHSYFHEKGIVCTDPNILTSSDCEGAGEMFEVAPQMFGDKKVGLTVSSQLPLEASATGFKEVYTCQKSFRAEKSDTSKHLAEFLHIEYEGYFLTLPKLLEFTEEFVKYCIGKVLEIRKDDFDFLEGKFSAKELHGTRKFLTKIIEKDFVKIKHRDAVDLIRKLVKDKAELPDDTGVMRRVKVQEWPEYDGDLASEHEKILVKHFDGFVFVTHWPLKIKSFYMKQCDDESGECESFDLLAPKVGEMFGGSMREWRYEKLDEEIKKRQMDITPIQWYLDLRKTGSAPHGGWGLGFDRLLMLVTGVASVRDVVPFPIYYGHCPY